MPLRRYGESIDSVVAAVDAMKDAIVSGLSSETPQRALAPGAGAIHHLTTAKKPRALPEHARGNFEKAHFWVHWPDSERNQVFCGAAFMISNA